MATVKVAVRVRPFNQREINMGAQGIIEVEGKKTRICNNKVTSDGEAAREKYKDFTFDYSYWSFDQVDEHFASQEQVFKDLGMDVVGNAFQGYNACVFAYGQTGSGKTHTMMGAPAPPESQGLIPRICKDMFNRMKHGKEKGTTYRTEVSYLEIYNERVKDLLKGDQTHSLRVREHPKQGPYVEGLSKHLVMDYDDIVGLMQRGNSNRTTASTNMNDVSSRSHAIFTMTFVQASFVGDMPSETVSKVHLVDLAGSERADASGATGQRLKEGAHINKSLVTLGSVISALAEASSQTQGQRKVFIPYRDSVLTWLLKDSLGGNAKTIMIATISPADCNYGETLSTLRYANRAKNIINKPTINEDPNVKLIRDLRNEIQKLKTMLTTNDGELDVLEEIQKKEAKEKSLTEEWRDKWEETQKILMEQKDLTLRKAGPGVVLDSQMPHLIGIDDDLHSTGITLYHLKEGETKIGSGESDDDKFDITLKGQGLESQHCSIMLENGVATLIPNNGAVCSVNGQSIDKPTRLSQGCVILLGRSNMFRYNDPAEAEKMRREGSRSQLNLNRLSFLSRSASDLAWSESMLNISANGEENSILEEKRRQLEAEEARLQKESQTLMEQKKLLEEQKQNYQQLQAEKEEAWKAEQINKSSVIQTAQKELEERRKKLEFEYSAHRRRLAEDWKRLEQQEQETLASLQSKEKDLQKRRELLEWDIDQEMDQIETEAQKLEALRNDLEIKQQEVDTFAHQLTCELEKKLGRSVEELRPVLTMEENKFQEYLDEQSKKIDMWKSSRISQLQEQQGNVLAKLNDLTDKLRECADEEVKAEYEKDCKVLQEEEKKINSEIAATDNLYETEKSKLKDTTATLQECRSAFLEKSKECKNLEEEVDKSMSKMMTSEDKISRLESDLALIADQEKLIVTQLAHIDNSKQKLKTIIENTSDTKELDEIDEKKQSMLLDINNTRDSEFKTASSTTSDNNNSNQLWELSVENSGMESQVLKSSTPVKKQKLSGDSSNELSPNGEGSRDLNYGEISPIRSNSAMDTEQQHKLISSGTTMNTSLPLHMTPAEITIELKRLVEQINEQKTVVLECLENDCDKEELNGHMVVLQELRNRYLEIECLLDNASRRRWLGFDEDESTFEYDKAGDDSNMANDSELDDSEVQSSVTDQDDIQAIIDQEVEKRLKEIFEQLKHGQKSNIYLRQQHGSILRSSMPSGLNQLNNGSGSEDEGSVPLPRSISMNSGVFASFAHGEWIIPGVLDVTIPSFVMRGNGSSTHFEYEVTIITPHDRWSVLRRYQRFRDLYSYMRKKYGPKIENITFPPKKFFGRRSEKLAKERQKLLEVFIQALLQSCSKLPTCPLYNCNSHKIKDALVVFSPFFQKGFFESTIYGTS